MSNNILSVLSVLSGQFFYSHSIVNTPKKSGIGTGFPLVMPVDTMKSTIIKKSRGRLSTMHIQPGTAYRYQASCDTLSFAAKLHAVERPVNHRGYSV
jgi:hypothetical protein